MVTVTLQAAESIAIIRNDALYKDTSSASITIGSATSKDNEKIIAIQFDAPGYGYKYKVIDALKIAYFFERIPVATRVLFFPFDKQINLMSDAPPFILSSIENGFSMDSGSAGLNSYIEFNFNRTAFPVGVNFLRRGGISYPREPFTDNSTTAVLQTSRGKNAPYISVTFSDVDYNLSVDQVSPSGGFLDENTANIFTWTYTDNGYCYDKSSFIEDSTFSLEWRQGSSGTPHTIAGTVSGATVPANTFPATGEVQARVKIVDALGNTVYSEWQSYTTTDSTSTATAISPANAVETDSAPVEFTWMHTISTGTEQTAAELQYSTDGATWSSLGSVDGSAQSLITSLAGLQPGTIFWRVRTANSDNVFSEWSSPVSFVLVAAPAAPIVSVIPVPMATINWQAAAQQAYRVTVDGRLQGGVKFGDASSFRVSAPLADGEHTAAVEVQGAFGLWSAPGTVTFTVAHIPGDDIELRGQHGIDADLSWETEAETNDFLIMRDGEPIGRTTDLFYSDRLVAGDHDYYILNIFTDGHYSKSNIVSVRSGSCLPVIADIDGGEWLEMTFSPNSATEQRFSWSKTSVARHFAGAKYPVIEMSAYEDKYATYTVAFKDMASAQTFEDLAGKICIIKSRSNEVMIGALTQIEKIAGDFFITYSFTLQQIDWRDGS